MLRYAFESLKKYYKNRLAKIILYVIFSILHKSSIILIPVLTQRLIDTAVAHNNITQLNHYGLLFLGTVILFILFLSARYYLQNNIETLIVNDIKLELFNKINTIPYEKLINKDVGFFIQRLERDCNQIRELIISNYTTLFINIVYVLAIIAVMFRLNLLMTLLLLILLPIFVILSKIFVPKIEQLNGKLLEKGETINSYAEETINGNYTLRINNAISYMINKVTNLFHSFFKIQMKEIKYEIIYDFVLVTGMMNIATLVTYWLGGYLVFKNIFSVGTLVAFTLYFSRLWDPIELFMEFPKKIGIAKVSLDRINELLNIGSENDANNRNASLDKFELLELKNIKFSYDDNRMIFNGLNFLVRKGDKIGINGSNGVGKSTLANLLIKIINPNEGDILYNGISYKDIGYVSIRDKVVLIPSDTYLFQTSINENISFGSETVSKKERTSFIDLENYFTKKGIHFDSIIDNKGQNLSGGEKKLIQLARGISRDGEIYIFDEPLNYVDKNFRSIIIEFIKTNFKDKTIIIISHDPDVFQICDRIYWMNDGKLGALNSDH